MLSVLILPNYTTVLVRKGTAVMEKTALVSLIIEVVEVCCVSAISVVMVVVVSAMETEAVVITTTTVQWCY